MVKRSVYTGDDREQCKLATIIQDHEWYKMSILCRREVSRTLLTLSLLPLLLFLAFSSV